jgi:hypothetical protein
MANDPRITRDSDFTKQEFYTAHGIDKHGNYHDYSAVNKEDAVDGFNKEVEEANEDDDE